MLQWICIPCCGSHPAASEDDPARPREAVLGPTRQAPRSAVHHAATAPDRTADLISQHAGSVLLDSNIPAGGPSPFSTAQRFSLDVDGRAFALSTGQDSRSLSAAAAGQNIHSVSSQPNPSRGHNHLHALHGRSSASASGNPTPPALAALQQATASTSSMTCTATSMGTMPPNIHLATAATTVRSEGGTEVTARLPDPSVPHAASALLASETSTVRMMDYLSRESVDHTGMATTTATATSSGIARPMAVVPAAAAQAALGSSRRLHGAGATGAGGPQPAASGGGGFSLFNALQAFVEQADQTSLGNSSSSRGCHASGAPQAHAGSMAIATGEFRGFDDVALGSSRDQPTANLYRVQSTATTPAQRPVGRRPDGTQPRISLRGASPLGPALVGGGVFGSSAAGGGGDVGQHGRAPGAPDAAAGLVTTTYSDTTLAMAAAGLVIGHRGVGLSTADSSVPDHAFESGVTAVDAGDMAAATAPRDRSAGGVGQGGGRASAGGGMGMFSMPSTNSFEGTSFLSGMSMPKQLLDEACGRTSGSHLGPGGASGLGSETDFASRTDNAARFSRGGGGSGWRAQRTADRREFLSAARRIGAVLQDVQIIALLGAGAHGKVYKGALRDRFVAVKVIYHETEAAPVGAASVGGSLRHVPSITSLPGAAVSGSLMSIGVAVAANASAGSSNHAAGSSDEAAAVGPLPSAELPAAAAAGVVQSSVAALGAAEGAAGLSGVAAGPPGARDTVAASGLPSGATGPSWPSTLPSGATAPSFPSTPPSGTSGASAPSGTPSGATGGTGGSGTILSGGGGGPASARPAVHQLRFQRAGSSNMHSLALPSVEGPASSQLPVLSLPGLPPVVMPHKHMLEGLISASAQHPNIVETYRIVTHLMSAPAMPAFVVTRGGSQPMWETQNLFGAANTSTGGGGAAAGQGAAGQSPLWSNTGRSRALSRSSSLGPNRDWAKAAPQSAAANAAQTLVTSSGQLVRLGGGDGMSPGSTRNNTSEQLQGFPHASGPPGGPPQGFEPEADAARPHPALGLATAAARAEAAEAHGGLGSSGPAGAAFGNEGSSGTGERRKDPWPSPTLLPSAGSGGGASHLHAGPGGSVGYLLPTEGIDPRVQGYLSAGGAAHMLQPLAEEDAEGHTASEAPAPAHSESTRSAGDDLRGGTGPGTATGTATRPGTGMGTPSRGSTANSGGTGASASIDAGGGGTATLPRNQSMDSMSALNRRAGSDIRTLDMRAASHRAMHGEEGGSVSLPRSSGAGGASGTSTLRNLSGPVSTSVGETVGSLLITAAHPILPCADPGPTERSTQDGAYVGDAAALVPVAGGAGLLLRPPPMHPAQDDDGDADEDAPTPRARSFMSVGAGGTDSGAADMDSAELILDLLGAQAAAQRSHSFRASHHQQAPAAQLGAAAQAGPQAGADPLRPLLTRPPEVPPTPGVLLNRTAGAAAPWLLGCGVDAHARDEHARDEHALSGAGGAAAPAAPGRALLPLHPISGLEEAPPVPYDYMVADGSSASATPMHHHFGLSTALFSSYRNSHAPADMGDGTGRPPCDPAGPLGALLRGAEHARLHAGDAGSHSHSPTHASATNSMTQSIGLEPSLALPAPLLASAAAATGSPMSSHAHVSAHLGSTSLLPTIDELTADTGAAPPHAAPAARSNISSAATRHGSPPPLGTAPLVRTTSSSAASSVGTGGSGVAAADAPTAGGSAATPPTRNSGSGTSLLKLPNGGGGGAAAGSGYGGQLMPSDLQYDKLSWSNTHTSANSTNMLLNSGFTALLASMSAGGSNQGGGGGASANFTGAGGGGSGVAAADGGAAASQVASHGPSRLGSRQYDTGPLPTGADDALAASGSTAAAVAAAASGGYAAASSAGPGVGVDASARSSLRSSHRTDPWVALLQGARVRAALTGRLSRSFTEARSPSRKGGAARSLVRAVSRAGQEGGAGGSGPSGMGGGASGGAAEPASMWSGVLAPPAGRERWQIFIVQELCTRGNLRDAIASGVFHASNVAAGTQVIAMRQLLDTAAEIASAMAYLHSRSVVHGDLKTANVMLQRNDADPRGFIAKLADFGLSRHLGAHGAEHGLLVSRIGTVTHMAPETIRDNMVLLASDVYSFGVILWELYCAQQPFANYTAFQLLSAVVQYDERPQFPTHCPPAYSSLAVRCMAKQPRARPSFGEVRRELVALRDGTFGGGGQGGQGGTISVPLGQARSEATRVLQSHLQIVSGSMTGGGHTSGGLRDFATQESNLVSSMESWDVHYRSLRRGE